MKQRSKTATARQKAKEVSSSSSGGHSHSGGGGGGGDSCCDGPKADTSSLQKIFQKEDEILRKKGKKTFMNGRSLSTTILM